MSTKELYFLYLLSALYLYSFFDTESCVVGEGTLVFTFSRSLTTFTEQYATTESPITTGGVVIPSNW